MKKKILYLAPIIAFLIYYLSFSFGLLTELEAKVLGITSLVVIYWVSEAIPIPAASLIPFALFPLFGVLSNKLVARSYGHWLIILLLGGFILSTAMEKSGLHKRIALGLIQKIGIDSPARLIFGFMLASWFLSGWISNTATTLMMLPIAMAIAAFDQKRAFAPILLMGLAYAASIGGMATPIGTPPNVVLMGVYEESLGKTIAFADWMKMAYPISFILLLAAWFFLTRKLGKVDLNSASLLKKLGPMTKAETGVLIVFSLTALAWMTRAQPFGGWSGLLAIKGIGDDTVALLSVIFLFLIPDGKGERLLDWETANKIPWGLLLLFGGGIAIAQAFQVSGLSKTIGAGLSSFSEADYLMILIVICLSVTFLTEVTSNTATTTLLMPILAAAFMASERGPLSAMFPAALSASCAFMLPVATAPNAIVFGSGELSLKLMLRYGIVLNLLGAALISLFCLFYF